MQFTMDVTRDYLGLKSNVTLVDAYTNSFVKAGQKPAGK